MLFDSAALYICFRYLLQIILHSLAWHTNINIIADRYPNFAKLMDSSMKMGSIVVK